MRPAGEARHEGGHPNIFQINWGIARINKVLNQDCDKKISRWIALSPSLFCASGFESQRQAGSAGKEEIESRSQYEIEKKNIAKVSLFIHHSNW